MFKKGGGAISLKAKKETHVDKTWVVFLMDYRFNKSILYDSHTAGFMKAVPSVNTKLTLSIYPTLHRYLKVAEGSVLRKHTV